MNEAEYIRFSVIIPVYNACETICRCLDSLLATKLEVEVIVVNDGSTDKTGEILNEYAEKDTRILVVNQENRGVSAARNVGLTLAKGEYILFVDSDDYVAERYFEKIDEEIMSTGADVVFFEFDRIDAGNQVSHCTLPEAGVDCFETFMALSKADMFGYTWCKAIRHSVLDDVRFDESIAIFEDEVFTAAFLNDRVQVALLHENIYRYVCTSTSSLSRATNESYAKFCDMAYCAWTELLDTDKDCDDFLQKKANCFAYVCKYYGLEQSANPKAFFKGMCKCRFLKDMTLEDQFLVDLRNGSWIRPMAEVVIYKLKAKIHRCLKGQ